MAEQARDQADRIEAGESPVVETDSYGCGYSEWDLLRDELARRGYGPDDISRIPVFASRVYVIRRSPPG